MNKTRKQQHNLVVALTKWVNEVRPSAVVNGLDLWRCGTQACFGGHLATWPEFQAQGVEQSIDGMPKMRHDLRTYELSQKLFGDSDLFCAREVHSADWNMPASASNHKIVTNRLEAALANAKAYIPL